MEKITGKILLVDDQPYEKVLLKEALASIDRFTKVEFISKAKEALTHLKKNRDEIFLIICDINMPDMNGLEFKEEIEKDSYLREKAIPFVFISNDDSENLVREAYIHNVQGYFKKPETIDAQGELLNKIVKYWASCLHPIMVISED